MTPQVSWDKSAPIQVMPLVEEADVIRKYESLIRHLARRFARGVYYSMVDDFAQIGRLAVLECWRTWRTRGEQTADFWTYARKAVVGEMLNRLSSEVARARVEMDSDLVPQATTPPDVAAEVREHMSVLTEPESQVIACFAAGNSVREIQHKTGIKNRMKVQRTLKGALGRLRERA